MSFLTSEFKFKLISTHVYSEISFKILSRCCFYFYENIYKSCMQSFIIYLHLKLHSAIFGRISQLEIRSHRKP